MKPNKKDRDLNGRQNKSAKDWKPKRRLKDKGLSGKNKSAKDSSMRQNKKDSGLNTRPSKKD